MSPRYTPHALFAAPLILAALACTDQPRSGGAPADAAAVQPAGFTEGGSTTGPIPVVAVTARDFAFDAPAQLTAGPTTFRMRNAGSLLHHMQVVRFSGGKTLPDYLTALRAGGPPPAWATEVGGPNAVAPGAEANATVALDPGDYGLLCFVDLPDRVPQLMKGMSRALRVVARPAGAGAPAAEPMPDVTMALMDYNFTVSGTLRPGRRVIRVENAGPQVHEVELFRIPPGQNMETLQRWLDTGTQGPPPAEPLGGVAGVAAGTSSSFTVELTPGKYALVCFIPDAKDGKPHFMHGMIQEMTVA